MNRRGIVSLLAAAAIGAAPAWAEPDETSLGKSLGYPVGTATNWFVDPYRVGSWSAMDRVRGLPVATVARGGLVTPLPRAAQPSEIRWRYRNLEYGVDDYLERQRVTGLLILKNGEVQLERYRYDRDATARFLSFSMAKSVTSILVGIALEKGLIASLDDPAEKYAKELAGSPYGGTSLRQLLRMSSGLVFTEHYDGKDDVARMSRSAATGQPPLVEFLRSIGERHSPAGEKFRYAGGETAVLGRVLQGASGRPVAQITSEWLWQPLGAEHDAFWVLSSDGQARTWGFFNASLRDWGRLGWMLAQDGRIGDRRIVGRDYLLQATDASAQPPAFRPLKATPYFGYGYQFWIFPLQERTFALQGIYGQAVFVQPSSGIVMVQTSVSASPSGQQDPEPARLRDAFWRGVLRSLGGPSD